MRFGQELRKLAVFGFPLTPPHGLADLQAAYSARHLQNVASLKPSLRLSALMPIPAVAWFRKPLISCSLYFLVLMAVIFRKDGLTLVLAGTAGKGVLHMALYEHAPAFKVTP